MKRLTAKQWQALPPEDREVLRRLDLLELIAPKPTASKSLLPESYILHRIIHCSLCQTISEEYLYMTPSPVNPSCLRSRKILEESIPSSSSIRKEAWTVPTCKHCLEVLLKESKETLVSKLILSTRKER